MLDALLVALKAIYDAPGNSALRAALPNYRVGPAEERVPLKTLIVQPVMPGSHREAYGTAKDGDIRISFSLFAEGGTGGPLIDLVTAAYDDFLPDLSGAGLDCSNVSRPNVPFYAPVRQKSENATEVAGWSTEYLYSVHKS